MMRLAGILFILQGAFWLLNGTIKLFQDVPLLFNETLISSNWNYSFIAVGLLFILAGAGLLKATGKCLTFALILQSSLVLYMIAGFSYAIATNFHAAVLLMGLLVIVVELAVLIFLISQKRQ